MVYYLKLKNMSLCIYWKNCKESNLRGNFILILVWGYCFCILKLKVIGMVIVIVYFRDVKELRFK